MKSPIDIPEFFQHDWPDTPYGSLGSLAEWGCGPTCFAMVASYLGDTVVTPADAAGAGDPRGHHLVDHFGPAGTAWTYYEDAEASFGIPHSIQTDDPEKVLAALARGQVAICSQAAGVFTTSGHLIVLRGLDSDGRILVHDPWKPHTLELGFNSRPFFAEEVFPTMRQCWIYPARG